MKKIGFLNGPNLKLLGRRDPSLYGSQTYEQLINYAEAIAKELNFELQIFQSNSEGEIIDFLLNNIDNFDGLVFNPGALGHYSIALVDALRILPFPKIEAHLTNTYKLEPIKSQLVTAQAVNGLVLGMGFLSYKLALFALNDLL